MEEIEEKLKEFFCWEKYLGMEKRKGHIFLFSNLRTYTLGGLSLEAFGDAKYWYLASGSYPASAWVKPTQIYIADAPVNKFITYFDVENSKFLD